MKSSAFPEHLFDVVALPGGGAPLSLAVALPGPSLTALPGFPPAALPHSGRVASGRGLTPESCRAGALGEAAELVSCCAWGDETLLSARARDLGPAALTPEILNGFSGAQIADRRSWNARYADFDWRPPLWDREKPIDWLVAADAYGGASIHVPADFAFIGRKEIGDRNAVAIGDSSGCACGSIAEEAKLAAALELIERDATARWWYGRGRRPKLAIRDIAGNGPLVSWLYERERQSFLFDITSDIDVPVVAAVSAECDGSDVAIGFAARLQCEEATLSALTEMLQMEYSLNAARALGDAAGTWAEWRERVNLTTPPLDAAPGDGRILGTRNTSTQLTAVLDACARSGIRLWFADMTRKIIGVPVFRAISPDLCHTKPRFGRERLLAAGARDISPPAASPETQVPLLI